jgi:NAD(P)H-dependent FMN reductase
MHYRFINASIRRNRWKRRTVEKAKRVFANKGFAALLVDYVALLGFSVLLYGKYSITTLICS